MKKLILDLLVTLVLLGASACTNDSGHESGHETNATLTATKWDLQSFEIINGEKSDIGSQGVILIFKEGGHLEGEAYRLAGDPDVSGNSYGADYEISADDSISITRPWTTKVGTPTGSRYWEYLDALENTNHYQIMGSSLRIFYNGKTKALNFKSE